MARAYNIAKRSYKGVQKIQFGDTTLNESAENYFIKKYAYSYDDILWSDWRNVSELADKTFSYKRTLYIKFQYIEKITDPEGEIPEFKSVDLVVTGPELNESCSYNDLYDNDNHCTANLAYLCNDSENLYNPYSIGSAPEIYKQLTTIVSNTFGIGVDYFKTTPNQNTKDYILNEYSLKNVTDKQQVKILIPDSNLPTNDFEVNTLMLNYPLSWEIHITKSEFRSKFGEHSFPQEHDYIAMNNKQFSGVWEVQSVRLPDDFLYESAYWRVKLIPFQKRAMIEYPEDKQSLLDETNLLILNPIEEERKEVIKEEIKEHRNKEQLEDRQDFPNRGDYEQDYYNETIKVEELVLYNNMAAVTRYCYNTSKITSDVAIRYHKQEELPNTVTISFLAKQICSITKPMTIMNFNGIKISMKNKSVSLEYNNVVKTFDYDKLITGWMLIVISFDTDDMDLCSFGIYEHVKRGIREQQAVFAPLGSVNITTTTSSDPMPVIAGTYEIYKSNVLLTNIRLWNNIVPKERELSICLGYLVKDSENIIIADDAIPQTVDIHDKQLNSVGRI